MTNNYVGEIAPHGDILFALRATIAFRLWFALWGIVAIVAHGILIVPNQLTLFQGTTRISEEVSRLLLSPWQRWDALWYLKIAEFGYSVNDSSAAYFPLLPILTRSFAAITQNYMAAALIVSTMASFISFLLLYRMTIELFNIDTAQRAVIYLATFPAAFFLYGGYAESVMLAASLATIYFARRHNAPAAGLASIAATLARPYGFLITLPLAIELAFARNKRLPWLIALVGAISALGFWLLFWQINSGDPFFWLHNTTSAWQDTYVFPGQTVLMTIQLVFTGRGMIGNNLLDLLATMIIVAAIIAGLRKLPVSFSAYALVLLITPLIIATHGPLEMAPMTGMARRSLIIFPAFMSLAAIWRGKCQEKLWIVSMSAFQTALFFIFVWWFMVD